MNRNKIDKIKASNEPCPLCTGRGNFFVCLKKDHECFYKCNLCSLIWLARKEQPKNDQAHYDTTYYKETFSGRKNTAVAFSNRMPFINRFLKKPGRVLEIGAAAGDFLHLLEQKGNEVSGVELSDRAVLRAKRDYGYEFFHGELRDAKFPDETFDYIVMYHVLEHVPNPQIILKEMHRILKVGGVIIIEVPHPSGVDARMSRKLLKNILDYPHHRYAFSPKFLKKLMRDSGFIIATLEASPSFLFMSVARKMLRIGKQSQKKVYQGGTKNQTKTVQDIPESLHTKHPFLYRLAGRILPGMRITVVARKQK